LTHDKIAYSQARFLGDGRRLLASGIEAGRGIRDYMIDVSTGDSKAITPEGTYGVLVSPQGTGVAVQTADNHWGIWDLVNGGFRAVPELGPDNRVVGWSPDSSHLYVLSSHRDLHGLDLSQVDLATGKTEKWKTFGLDTGQGSEHQGVIFFTPDGRAYAYLHHEQNSVAYVVTGLR
jgi:Tol biopolymer transport system component